MTCIVDILYSLFHIWFNLDSPAPLPSLFYLHSIVYSFLQKKASSQQDLAQQLWEYFCYRFYMRLMNAWSFVLLLKQYINTGAIIVLFTSLSEFC